MTFNIFHEYETDGGFGDAVCQCDLIATVEATKEEIDAFVKEWNHPRIYDRPYAELSEHTIYAEPVEITKLSEVVPYNPEDKDKPDLPEKPKNAECGKKWFYDRDTKKYIWITYEEARERNRRNQAYEN